MNKDKFNEVLKIVLLVVALLLLLSLVPSTDIQYKQFRLLSGLLGSDNAQQMADELIPEEPTLQDSLSSARKDSLEQEEKKQQIGELDVSQKQEMGVLDFSEGGTALRSFFQSMQTCKKDNRKVRIGVLGDSFIEADIMTSKLRELLQSEYGGMGVGFVPVASPAAQFRKTVQHVSKNWTSHSMVYYKNADWKRFCLSGYYFVPSQDASFSLKIRKNETVSCAEFFFINRNRTKIHVSVNGEQATLHEPPSSASLQSLRFTDSSITSLDVSLTDVDGFTGFGTYLDNPFGVYVDNYSVRGSSGSVLVTVDKDLTGQFTKHVSYDLLIVQYGLNVISNKSYAGYQKLMTKAILHLQECYPGVPVLLMSIGDKGARDVNGFVSHPGVLPLIKTQMKIAQETHICFWNTYQAMGGDRSMVNFVNHSPPLAAKDYTHINFAGGDVIAQRLYDALIAEKKRLFP